MYKKSVFYLGILALLLFSACSKKNEKEPEQDTKSQDVNSVSIASEGNYAEIELPQLKLEPEEHWFGSKTNSKNQFEIYTCFDTSHGETKVCCYTLIDGDFQKASVGWAEKACKELNASPDELCQSEDGNEYIQFVRAIDTGDGKRKGTDVLIKKSEDGEGYENVTPSHWYDENSDKDYYFGPFIAQIKITKNQILCYKEDFNKELCFYDLKKGEKIDCGSISTQEDYVVKENTIYYIDEVKKTINVQNLENDETEQIPVASNCQADLTTALLQVMPDDSILLMNTAGLHIKTKSGTMWETIVDGNHNSMSKPNYQAKALCFTLGENHTYYAIYQNTTHELDDLYVKYEPGANEEPTSTKELTICSLYNNPTVKYAVDRFRVTHKDVKVNYNVIRQFNKDNYLKSEGSYDILLEDAIRTMNTEILGGNSPDIIILDDLPIFSYIEKGILMDISELFDDQSIPVLKNIADYYRNDSKLYYMPARIHMPLYATYEDFSSHTKTVEDLAAYCEEKGVKLRESCGYAQLVNLFLSTYYEEIFTSDGQIDKDRLTTFLNSLDKIAKQIGAGEEPITRWHPCYDNGIVPEVSVRMNDIFLGKADSLMWDQQYLLSTTFAGNNREILNLIGIMSLIDGTYEPINQIFVPSSLVGITQSTKNPDLAKEFVTMLFSDGVQHVDLWDGFPVNEESLNSWVKDGDSIGLYSWSAENGEQHSYRFDRVTAENMQSIVDMLKTLEQPIYDDVNGRDIIITGAFEYLKGDKTLEQAVDEIAQKFSIYVSE